MARKLTNTEKWLKEAEKFFYRHAGFGYNPLKETKEQGRRRAAKALALAEQYATAHGWYVQWEQEQDPDLSWADEAQLEKIEQVVAAILYDARGKALGSLGNITEGYDPQANRDYRRVVEAELALEAMPD